MRNITILALDGSSLSSIAIPLDIFGSAGVLWNVLFGLKPKPLFNVKTASVDGKPVKSLSGISLIPNCAVNDADNNDLIIISDLNRKQHEYKKILNWLIAQNRKGTHIATICTGAFLLAETGLLNGKTATTHWGAAKEFRKRYSQVFLKPQRLVTDEGDLYCSGGANAGADLSLYLISKYHGYEIAFQTAKALVIDPGRESQAPYAIFNFEKYHDDGKIIRIQEWMEKNYGQEIRIDFLAKKSGMTRRTFERRFKNATGDTPLRYLQRVRIEKAKQLLEKGTDTFSEITYHVGYEDSSTFRKIFIKQTALTPTLYRNQFSKMKFLKKAKAL